MEQVSAFRYRAEDAMRSITKSTVRDPRTMEIINSEKLKCSSVPVGGAACPPPPPVAAASTEVAPAAALAETVRGVGALVPSLPWREGGQRSRRWWALLSLGFYEICIL
ncbi:hypothetical protein HK405_002783 [Cladochytrium tenue]|nr:hypothetical protein HK405_002783 [Cladochytrium tenue]